MKKVEIQQQTTLLNYVPQVLSCSTCLVPHMPRALHVLVQCVPHTQSALVRHVPWNLCALVLDVPLASRVTCFTYSRGSPSSLASGISTHVSQLSCLVSLMFLVFQLFEFFTIWVKVNHCDMPFLKKEHRYNGFSYNCYTSPESINLTTLTNFNFHFNNWLVSFFSP